MIEVRRLYEMFSRVVIFMMGNISDFQAIPFVAATVTELQPETAKLSALAVGKVQTTAATAKNSTISRGDARDILHDALKDIADVWKSVNTNSVKISNKFRMPRGSDQNMIAVAKTFAVDAEANKQFFTSRGLPTNFIADLQAKTAAFEQAIDSAETARGERVGTNAAFDEPIKKCKSLIAILEPAVKRTYRTNPRKMAEWLVASHVERAAQPGNLPAAKKDENT